MIRVQLQLFTRNGREQMVWTYNATGTIKGNLTVESHGAAFCVIDEVDDRQHDYRTTLL